MLVVLNDDVTRFFVIDLTKFFVIDVTKSFSCCFVNVITILIEVFCDIMIFEFVVELIITNNVKFDVIKQFVNKRFFIAFSFVTINFLTNFREYCKSYLIIYF